MKQEAIDYACLENLRITRHRLDTDWPRKLYPPKSPDGNHSILLPFVETYENAFSCMYKRDFYANHAKGGLLQLWLNDTAGEPEPPAEAVAWLQVVGRYIALQDRLALSFALDYTCVDGNPDGERTEIAKLRRRAKPYDCKATAEHRRAAEQLSEVCVQVLSELTCYDRADCLVAVPPSDPDKAYNLPRVIAARISDALGIDDLSNYISTTGKRASVKNTPLAEKLAALRGTIQVTPGHFEGKSVLLVDDFYQSGLSMNYCAHLLQQAGAKHLFGFACEKTCRNDGNV